MGMFFNDWLHRPQSDWKVNLENCDPRVFSELKMERKEVEEILEILDEFGVFAKVHYEE
ncbi:hypothetical protein [Lysinibacillus fusiformis]|uniref:hypothetical protein n=1 Tax=Lysinibacillus fusiformis TaxID=28031 RepID=UPI00263B49B8|nr:hypothetical protein [Lysinibacillus fusiformis]MDC6267382.1 hypothetical protein [Lysinibacillus sphaericus]MDN4968184.1 hypothetical protein [Lysinibacillus fusiformis]MDN4968358.1 hypothetical protein [Lysinibacillus fusiformis]